MSRGGWWAGIGGNVYGKKGTCFIFVSVCMISISISGGAHLLNNVFTNAKGLISPPPTHVCVFLRVCELTLHALYMLAR